MRRVYNLDYHWNQAGAIRPAPLRLNKKNQSLVKSTEFDESTARVVIALGFFFSFGLAFWSWISFPDEALTIKDQIKTSFLGFLISGAVSLNTLVLIWRIILVRKYRPALPCPDKHLPVCTVVVPAYNEGRHVLETLRSVAASDYPMDKLQIIGVDDGSKDDTWSWMQRAAQELGSRIELVRLPVNCGKRRALYEGFRRAIGEILVTIDSDSLIEPRTLRYLVSPFRHDLSVGAVAGNVRVLNIKEGLIPRMLDVNFTYSFEFIRAGQSRVNTVMCTPGALSAYRRSVIAPLLDGWLNQQFLGRPANIGEDRALSNLVLRSGYHVHFQREAVVYTKVPTAYQGLCRMFLRWARSNIRETIVMSGFIFKRFRRTPALGARINLLLTLFGMTVGEFLKVSSFYCLFLNPLFILNVPLGAAVGCLPPALFYILYGKDRRNCVWAFPYTLFWTFGLSWISLYALFTARRSGWLTREIKQPSTVSRQAARPASIGLPNLGGGPGFDPWPEPAPVPIRLEASR